jgi:hypothetical protein
MSPFSLNVDARFALLDFPEHETERHLQKGK